jgi:hypothetical protein
MGPDTKRGTENKRKKDRIRKKGINNSLRAFRLSLSHTDLELNDNAGRVFFNSLPWSRDDERYSDEPLRERSLSLSFSLSLIFSSSTVASEAEYERARELGSSLKVVISSQEFPLFLKTVSHKVATFFLAVSFSLSLHRRHYHRT